MKSAVKVIIMLVICLVLIYHLIENRENWVPWVWNIPTRDIYPPIYYNPRCAPPVYHFYDPPSINPEQKVLLVKPRYIRRRNCPYDF